jgi:hypothetical protein
MKTYRRTRGIVRTIFNLDTRWKVVSSVYASAPTENEAGRAQEWLEVLERNKKSLAPVGNRTEYNPVRSLFTLQATCMNMCVVTMSSSSSSSIIATFCEKTT